MTMTDDDTEVALTELAPEQSTAWSDYADDDDHNDDRHTWLVPSVCVAVAALAVVLLSVVWVRRGAPSARLSAKRGPYCAAIYGSD
jgi:hypothetical protein